MHSLIRNTKFQFMFVLYGRHRLRGLLQLKYETCALKQAQLFLLFEDLHSLVIYGVLDPILYKLSFFVSEICSLNLITPQTDLTLLLLVSCVCVSSSISSVFSLWAFTHVCFYVGIPAHVYLCLVVTCWVNLCLWGSSGAGRPSGNCPLRVIIVTSHHRSPLNLWVYLSTRQQTRIPGWGLSNNVLEQEDTSEEVWWGMRIGGNLASSSSKCVSGGIKFWYSFPALYRSLLPGFCCVTSSVNQCVCVCVSRAEWLKHFFLCSDVLLELSAGGRGAFWW